MAGKDAQDSGLLSSQPIWDFCGNSCIKIIEKHSIRILILMSITMATVEAWKHSGQLSKTVSLFTLAEQGLRLEDVQFESGKRREYPPSAKIRNRV